MINDTLAVLFVVAGTLTTSVGFALSLGHVERYISNFSRRRTFRLFAGIENNLRRP